MNGLTRRSTVLAPQCTRSRSKDEGGLMNFLIPRNTIGGRQKCEGSEWGPADLKRAILVARESDYRCRYLNGTFSGLSSFRNGPQFSMDRHFTYIKNFSKGMGYLFIRVFLSALILIVMIVLPGVDLNLFSGDIENVSDIIDSVNIFGLFFGVYAMICLIVLIFLLYWSLDGFRNGFRGKSQSDLASNF